MVAHSKVDIDTTRAAAHTRTLSHGSRFREPLIGRDYEAHGEQEALDCFMLA